VMINNTHKRQLQPARMGSGTLTQEDRSLI
jgi:hypothetical protein